MIINEWQLGGKLNRSLQAAQRADFAYYLALLSPRVDESAEFFTPEVTDDIKTVNLYNALNVVQARPFQYSEGDAAILHQQSCALYAGGLAQLKLQSCLKAAPLTEYNDAKRLDTALLQSLSLHSRRQLTGENLEKPEADPSSLYDVLQKLHHAA